MFIKMVLEAAFSFPNILQITKAALNHVDNIESITSNVRFDFVGLTRRVERISIIATAVVNIGACDAVPAVAPKRTGSGPGIVTIISLW